MNLMYPNTALAFPPDRPTYGCRPRASKPGKWCPMAVEHITLVPRGDWAAVAAEREAQQAGLRQCVGKVKDQDGVGSCATESTTGALEIGRSIAGLSFVELNPWFIYHTTSHGRDRGSSIDENLAFARENGVAPESIWPRSKGWQAKPSAEAVEAAREFKIVEFYDVANIDEMVSCLLHGWPVVYGSKGHSVVKIAHLNEREGLDLNSWGTSWGDGGFGVWAKYNQVEFGYGMFAVRTTSEVKL